VFVLGKPFQPSVLFQSRLLAALINIRLGWKGLPGINTPGYLGTFVSYEANKWHYDTHYKDIQPNDTQHKGLINMHSAYTTLFHLVECHKLVLYAECHYAACRYAECRGAK
jgi:hypothetical protein